MRYVGGKGQAGVYQRIISLMPPHDVYIETHLGGGNILERKRPAGSSIAIDIDADVASEWKGIAESGVIPGVTVIEGDAVEFLRGYTFTGRELVYSDPPYVMSTRKSGPRYRHEYSDAQHFELLDVLRTLKCHVMLSGYRCPMYDASLVQWHRIDFDVQTRGGTWATESLWCNFEPARELHDYRYIGGNFRERERIKRKRNRWRAKFAKLPEQERHAMLEVLLDLASPDAPMATSASADQAMVGIEPAPVRAKRKPFELHGELPDAYPFPRDPTISRSTARRIVGLDASTRKQRGERAGREPKIQQNALYVCPVRQRTCFAMGMDCDANPANAPCPLLGGPNAGQEPSSQLTLLEDSPCHP